ncbi:MAG: 3-phosphoshikimate 1-carboxyvinyltransferase [Lachnospiraceae bacterium]|nr:3-phosphoshikimate 1-carboxyvinyltransferase [Lachnospiraceae bacterium]
MKTKLKIDNKKLNTTAIASKSYVHRLLIGAALSSKPSYIFSNIISKDMEATVNCLNALGADIEIEADGFNVKSGVSKQDIVNLDCNESGSTARFMLPLAAFLSNESTMTGHGKLPERPFGPLTKALGAHGVTCSSEFLPITTKGELKAGDYELPGNISSQYITGLLIVLPLLDGDSKIIITTELESKGYIDITLDVLKQFGIEIEFKDNIFYIKGNQTYEGDEKIYAEGDWSNSGFLLGLGAIDGEVTLKGLNPDSLQGDRGILDILKVFGADVRISKNEITVAKRELHGVDIDASQIPDLVPALALIAAFADSDSRFRHVERLRIKESDRIETIKETLKAFSREAVCEKTADGEDLIVKADANSINELKDIVVNSFNDHRIVMAAVLGAWGSNKEIEIDGSEAINKSFPGFFDLFK